MFEKTKIDEKDAGVGPFLKNFDFDELILEVSRRPAKRRANVKASGM